MGKNTHLIPRHAVRARTGDKSLQIHGPHAHDTHRILLLELHTRDQSCMHDLQLPHVSHMPELQNQRTSAEIVDLFLRKRSCQFSINCIAMRKTLRIQLLFQGGRFAIVERAWGRGRSLMERTMSSEPMGFQVSVSEQHPVFVVAPDA